VIVIRVAILLLATIVFAGIGTQAQAKKKSHSNYWSGKISKKKVGYHGHKKKFGYHGYKKKKAKKGHYGRRGHGWKIGKKRRHFNKHSHCLMRFARYRGGRECMHGKPGGWHSPKSGKWHHKKWRKRNKWGRHHRRHHHRRHHWRHHHRHS